MQKFFCPIGVRRNLFESSSAWSYRTATPYRKLRIFRTATLKLQLSYWNELQLLQRTRSWNVYYLHCSFTKFISTCFI